MVCPEDWTENLPCPEFGGFAAYAPVLQGLARKVNTTAPSLGGGINRDYCISPKLGGDAGRVRLALCYLEPEAFDISLNRRLTA